MITARQALAALRCAGPYNIVVASAKGEPVGELTLVMGTKNYSSWSLRPWLALKQLGLPFTERVIHFDTPEFGTAVPLLSPTRRVPVLLHGDLRVWESLAICEYASELAGGRGWPADPGARATARALACEMHAGFPSLRAACPMNCRARDRRVPMTPALEQDIRRIDAIWSARPHGGGPGPWLFGEYSVADAMFAPVALRFLTYGLPLSRRAGEYLSTVLADRHLREWLAAAASEAVVIPADEAGTPA
jgi:glutathione S-transferase